MTDELKPCPFCGVQMVDIETDQECIWWVHPKEEGCFFSEWEFCGVSLATWNRRAGEGE